MRPYPLLLSLAPASCGGGSAAPGSPPIPAPTAAPLARRRNAKKALCWKAALTLLTMLVSAAAADANCLARSQSALTVVEAADAYTIIKTVQAGHVGYDRMAPFCASKPLREIACQGALNLAIRVVEKPTKQTCLLNYAAAIGYSLYIRKALGAQFGFRL